MNVEFLPLDKGANTVHRLLVVGGSEHCTCQSIPSYRMHTGMRASWFTDTRECGAPVGISDQPSLIRTLTVGSGL